MKKFSIGLLLVLVMLLGMSTLAFADDPPIDVVLDSAIFTAEGKMNFNPTQTILAEMSGMQPGDTMVLHIPLLNENGKAVDWYMKNWVQESLEDNSANSATEGGGYTYHLTYTGPGTSSSGDVLYDSERVGGDAPYCPLRRADVHPDCFRATAAQQQERGGTDSHIFPKFHVKSSRDG